jgi:hypothetical protein
MEKETQGKKKNSRKFKKTIEYLYIEKSQKCN